MKKQLLFFMSVLFLANVTNVTYAMEEEELQSFKQEFKKANERRATERQAMSKAEWRDGFQERIRIQKNQNQLIIAIKTYDITAVKKAILEGANVNDFVYNSRLPLYEAIKGATRRHFKYVGHSTVVDKKQTKLQNARGLNIITVLAAAGADPNAFSRGHSLSADGHRPLTFILNEPIFWDKEQNKAATTTIKTLLKIGANPYLTTYGGQTPLDVAIEGNHATPEIIALLKGGADLQLKRSF